MARNKTAHLSGVGEETRARFQGVFIRISGFYFKVVEKHGRFITRKNLSKMLAPDLDSRNRL